MKVRFREFQTTVNSKLWKKLYKQHLAKGVSLCPYCRFNRDENGRNDRDYRCWKRHRKTQFRL